MAQDLDAEFPQQCLGDGADRHPRGRLPRAGPFQDVARVVKIVLDGAGQVGVPRPRTRDGFALRVTAGNIFHRQDFGPVLPVLVADEHRHGRTDGMGMAHAGHDFGAVGLDLHPSAAPVALLAAPQFPVHGVQ